MNLIQQTGVTGWLALRALASGLLCLVGFHLQVSAQVAIDDIQVRPDGHIEIRFPMESDSYYLLLQGDSVVAISQPSAIRLGEPGVGTFVEDSSRLNGPNRFYRLQRIPKSAPLDTDGDGIDDVTELSFGNALNALDPLDGAADPDGDGLSTAAELRLGRNPFVRELEVTTFASSPASGENHVSVNRETYLRFSRPLASGTLLSPAVLRAEAGGRTLLTRVDLSGDRRSATLFYLEPLPGATRVRVTFNAASVKDELGQLVDGDKDGRPGGSGVVEFDTIGNLAVPNTAVVGQVFASELGTNPLGEPINRALSGVIITVDGAEERLRAVTDAEGRFRLSPAPSGRFFVHIDGRLAVGSSWPGGDYYPVVGKAWESVAGRTNNLAGGTGLIFLPLIPAGTLQLVSETRDTTIEFPGTTLTKHPELKGVQITVPANALFSENGARGGRVGIAPVPPDRLPGPLPAGVQLPLVITVQTDGPLNFDRPAPVQFPNLPDPETGITLAPGSKTALLSFNHDSGEWEIAGSMTISADGRFAVSDPGTGIRQPGWHGTSPLCTGVGGGAPGTGPDPGASGQGGLGGLSADGTGPAPGSIGGAPGDSDLGGDDAGQPPGDDRGPGDDGPSGGGGGGGAPCGVEKVMKKKNAVTGFFEELNNGERAQRVYGRQIVTITMEDSERVKSGISIRGYEVFETLFDIDGHKKVFRFSFPMNISTNLITRTITLSQEHISEDPEEKPTFCEEDVYFSILPNAGAHWAPHFKGSKEVSALKQPFRGNLERFIGALNAGGGKVIINDTFRPQKRAYLMHFSGKLARLGSRTLVEPPPYNPLDPVILANCDGDDGCVGEFNFNWIYADRDGNLDRRTTIAAARALYNTYGIAFPAGFPGTRHSVGRAVDMKIDWPTITAVFPWPSGVLQPDGVTRGGTIEIRNESCIGSVVDENGEIIRINFNNNCNPMLHKLGAAYGVIKLVVDPPHWSDDGH